VAAALRNGHAVCYSAPVNNFDGLRLIAALLVLVSHQFAVTGRPEPHLFGDTLGTFGVYVFFSISGYLVAKSWHADPSIPRFLARRGLRIWPLLTFVAVALAALAAALTPLDRQALQLLSNAALVFSDARFFPDNPVGRIHGPWWTIKFEVACYLALCALGLLAGARARWGLVAAAVAGAAFYFAVGLDGLPFRRMWLIKFGAFFVIGALLFYFPSLLAGRRAALLAAASTLLLVVTDIALMLLVPLACLWVGLRAWPGLRDAAAFGDLSYGTYLWAWPVQQVGVWWLGAAQPLWLLGPFSVVGTLALAALTWRLIEQPALRLKPKRVS
jgi:peptidoglycan/LPS O-acetylase OafA/YrhL